MKYVATLLIAVFVGPARAADLPPEVRAGLENYARLDPIAVTATAMTELRDVTTFGAACGPAMTAARRTTEETFAVSGGLLYVARRPVAGLMRGLEYERAFDGVRVTHLAPGPGGKRLCFTRARPADGWDDGGYYATDYCRAAGLLPAGPRSELLALLAGGGRVTSVGATGPDGRMVRVEVEATDPDAPWPNPDGEEWVTNIWDTEGNFNPEELRKQLAQQAVPGRSRRLRFDLDPTRGYAVVLRERRDESGRLLERREAFDHEPIAGRKLWLPRRCRIETFSDGPRFVTKVVVTAIDAEPRPPERFRIPLPTAIAAVRDDDYPEVRDGQAVYYGIGATPADTARSLEFARRAVRRENQTADLQDRGRRLFWAANAGLVAAMAVLLARRVRAK